MDKMLDFKTVTKTQVNRFRRECKKLADLLELAELYELGIRFNLNGLEQVKQYLFQERFGLNTNSLNGSLVDVTNTACCICDEPSSIYKLNEKYQARCNICGQKGEIAFSVEMANKGFEFQQEMLRKYK